MNVRWRVVVLLCCLFIFEFGVAANGVPGLLPFQGRVTDSSGNPINSSVVINFRIYPPSGSCYIFEETQTVTPNSFGLFSVILGTGISTGPSNTLAQVFNNDPAAPLPDACFATYAPAAHDWRRLELVVDGRPLGEMQTIGASGFAINSQFLEGKSSADFIWRTATVNSVNLEALVSGNDASHLHHHDNLYLKSDGSSSSNNFRTTQNIYATGATSSVGVGTSAPLADLHIKKDSPSLRLESNAGSGGAVAVDFYSGAAQRGRIEAGEAVSGLKFYSGSNLVLDLDNTAGATFSGSVRTTGSLTVGNYNNAQEALLTAFLTALGGGGAGTIWWNSSVNQAKYWDGQREKVFASLDDIASGISAGSGVSITGPAAARTVSVLYGSTANTAIEGNAAFGGDVSGNYANVSVDKIRGTEVDFSTPPVSGQVLSFNSGRWIASTPASAVQNLNGLTGNLQNFANGTLGVAPTFVSSGSTHTLNIPLAANAGVNAGLISKAEYDLFHNKQSALGYVPVNKAGDVMAGPLTLSGDPTANLHSTTKQYVDGAIATATQDIATRTYVDSTALPQSGGTLTGSLILRAPAAASGTAPLVFQSGSVMTAPQAGAMEYNGTSLYQTDSTNQRRTVPLQSVIVKSADEVVTNSTVLQDDNNFTFTGVANTRYHVDMVLHISTPSATPDIKFAFILPSGSMSLFISNPTGSGVINGPSGTVEMAPLANSTKNILFIRGFVTIGATGGPLRMQWAQNTANGNGVTLKANSYMIFHPL